MHFKIGERINPQPENEDEMVRHEDENWYLVRMRDASGRYTLERDTEEFPMVICELAPKSSNAEMSD